MHTHCARLALHCDWKHFLIWLFPSANTRPTIIFFFWLVFVCPCVPPCDTSRVSLRFCLARWCFFVSIWLLLLVWKKKYIKTKMCANRSGSYDYFVVWFVILVVGIMIVAVHLLSRRIEMNRVFLWLKFDFINYVTTDSKQILYDSMAKKHNWNTNHNSLERKSPKVDFAIKIVWHRYEWVAYTKTDTIGIDIVEGRIFINITLLPLSQITRCQIQFHWSHQEKRLSLELIFHVHFD